MVRETETRLRRRAPVGAAPPHPRCVARFGSCDAGCACVAAASPLFASQPPHVLLRGAVFEEIEESNSSQGPRTKKETNAEMKEGQQEARELSASNYGCNEWWLLLEPTAEPSAKRLRR